MTPDDEVLKRWERDQERQRDMHSMHLEALALLTMLHREHTLGDQMHDRIARMIARFASIYGYAW